MNYGQLADSRETLGAGLREEKKIDFHKFLKLFYKVLGLDGFSRFFSKKGPIDSTCY